MHLHRPSVQQGADDPHAQRIAVAAKRLVELRDNWLNPLDLATRAPEVVPGFPDRILPVNEEAAKELKKRTLTNLYNQRPAWLQHAHAELDAAVAAAYGWPHDLSDEQILERLLALNLERASRQGAILATNVNDIDADSETQDYNASI